MAFGKDTQTLKKEEIAKELIPHKMMPGNRPSTTIILDELEPYILGQLISFYEQSILIQGLLLQINSFDQFGVELGKKNAQQIYRKLTNQDNQKFDKSTENLIKHLKN
jgi:glucose-6-phosphate isomerase